MTALGIPRTRNLLNAGSLNFLIYGLCLIAPWSLLWLDSGLLFPYATGKAWAFRSLTEFAFALSLVLRMVYLFSGSSRDSHSPIARTLRFSLIMFLCWTALTGLTGIDIYRSFWSNWERMGGMIDYLHWAMYLVCLLTVLDNTRSRLMLINLVIVISLVSAIGLLDEEERSISTLGNPIYLGNLAVFGLFIAAFLFAGCRKFSHWKLYLMQILLLLAMAVMGIALIKSASRGAVVALLAGGLVVVFTISVDFLKQRSRPVAVLVITGLLVSGSLLVANFDKVKKALRHSDYYAVQRLGQISLRDQTTADRLENWQIALNAAESRPWFGWGQENYLVAFNEFYKAGAIDRGQLWFDRAHNAFLDVLLASGVPGLMLYCLILGLSIWAVWRIERWSSWEKRFVTGLFTAFIVKNIVGFDTFSSTLILISMIALILTSLKEPVSEKTVREAVSWTNSDFRLKLISLLILLIAFLSIYWLNLSPYQANLRFASLMNEPLALRSKALGEILNQPVTNLRNAQNSKLAVYDAVLTKKRGKRLTAYEAERMQQVYRRAVELINESLRQQPRSYRIKYNGALLFARLGQYDLAIPLLEELIQIAPNRTAFWYALSQVYAAQGQTESAMRARKTAANLNPGWKP